MTTDRTVPMPFIHAKADEVHAGDTLIADGGFTCIRGGARLTVHADSEGHLYVECDEGSHDLAGQLTEADTLIGLMKAPAA